MDFLDTWWAFASTRWDQVQIGLIEHTVYVVGVLSVASVFAIVLGVATRRSPTGSRTLSGNFLSLFDDPLACPVHNFYSPGGIGFCSLLPCFCFCIRCFPFCATPSPVSMASISVSLKPQRDGLDSHTGFVAGATALAWPVIIAGIRVSAMLVVGVASIATLVAGGGLGDFIKSGLARLPPAQFF